MHDAIRNIDAVTALMTALRKGLNQITICRSVRETAAFKQSHLTFPPGWAFPSAPGYLLTAASVLPHSVNMSTGKRKYVNTIVFQCMLE